MTVKIPNRWADITFLPRSPAAMIAARSRVAPVGISRFGGSTCSTSSASMAQLDRATALDGGDEPSRQLLVVHAPPPRSRGVVRYEYRLSRGQTIDRNKPPSTRSAAPLVAADSGLAKYATR